MFANAQDNDVNRALYAPDSTNVEIERRFMVTDTSKLKFFDSGSKRIEQYYIALADNQYCRIRFVDNKAVMMVKTGWGRERIESTVVLLSDDQGKWLLNNLPVRSLIKDRYTLTTEETVDVYRDPEADGLVVLEYEGDDAATFECPEGCVEITDKIDNAIIAQWIWEKREGISEYNVKERLLQPVRRISLDGAGGCGKTTIFNRIRDSRSDLVYLPEVARLLMEQGMVTIPLGNAPGMKSFEGLLFRTHDSMFKQAEQEVRRTGKLAVLEDRHPLSVLCYMNNNEKDFEQVTGTTLQRELSTADVVIYLELPPKDIYEAIRANDKIRYESYEEGLIRDKMFRETYNKFGSKVHYIPFADNFDTKFDTVRKLIEKELG